MSTVTVPAEFFRGELDVYGSWREAFARELLQNAQDARPTRIDVTFDTVDGHGQVVFSDDGCGMTREVLEDVFFALGKTTKINGDTIGGFGRARIIICFAQIRYRIRTGRLLVQGHGSEYTITEVDEDRKGCEFTIDLIDVDVEPVRRAFQNLLQHCSLTAPVTLDGQPAEQATMPSRANRILRDEHGKAWARVYVRPSYSSMLRVRVHGLTMYSSWLESNDQVIVELVANRSREVLTASRDQLRDPYLTQLDEFKSALGRNRSQALRPETDKLDVHVGGGGFIVSSAQTDETAAADTAAGEQTQASGTTMLIPVAEFTGPIPPASTVPVGTIGAGLVPAEPGSDGDDLFALLPDGVLPARPVNGLGFDVFLFAEESNAKTRKLARVWDPNGWDATTGRRRRALLLAWKAVLLLTVTELLRYNRSLGSIAWAVGWVFDPATEAGHRNTRGGHVFAVNPVTADGTAKFHLSQRGSRQLLLALALHEVTHAVCDGHDEDFAVLLTDLVARVDPFEADRVMREAARAA